MCILHYHLYVLADLNTFRQALATLQAQVDDLDRLKSEYYESVLAHEEEIWDFALGKIAYSVRTTLDVYDRITAKSSDPHLEPLILSIPDPFDTYGPPKSEEHIFSILPPLGLSMSLASSPSPSPMPLHPPSTSAPAGSTMSPSPSAPSLMPSSSRTLNSSPNGPSWTSPFPTSSTAPTLVLGSAEWADAPSASTGPFFKPQPAFPPRNGTSIPITRPSTGSNSKAETKLRSVLSAASEDELSAQGDDETDSDTSTEADREREGRGSSRHTTRASVQQVQDESGGGVAVWQQPQIPVRDSSSDSGSDGTHRDPA